MKSRRNVFEVWGLEHGLGGSLAGYIGEDVGGVVNVLVDLSLIGASWALWRVRAVRISQCIRVRTWSLAQ